MIFNNDYCCFSGRSPRAQMAVINANQPNPGSFSQQFSAVCFIFLGIY